MGSNAPSFQKLFIMGRYCRREGRFGRIECRETMCSSSSFDSKYGAFDRLFKISYHVARITAEYFVTSLSSENHFYMVGGQFGNNILGEKSWSGNRLIQVIN